jgi:endonuclease/exonuclease/phosphatase family metal-dependent hydrolase
MEDGMIAHAIGCLQKLMPVALMPMGAAVRVMSFNLRNAAARDGQNEWEKRKPLLVDTVMAFDPDLLGTQETLLVQRDYLAAKLADHAVVGVGRIDGEEDGEFAAVLYRKSRFDLIDSGHFWLSETPQIVGSNGWDASLPRMATWVKLRDRLALGAKPIFWLNTHFDHIGERARVESARLVRCQIDQLGGGCRWVITGDFNIGDQSEAYDAMFAGSEDRPSPLVDTYREVHPQRGREEGTFCEFDLSRRDGMRIDWIACSRDWRVLDAAIDHSSDNGRMPSDHFPITATLVARE